MRAINVSLPIKINSTWIDHHAQQPVSETRQRADGSCAFSTWQCQTVTRPEGFHEFDALIIPGGFGAAKNFSDFAVKGADAAADQDVVAFCQQFAAAKKPAGYMCIAPSLLPFVYGHGIQLTIGNDNDTAQALEQLGAKHIDCAGQ